MAVLYGVLGVVVIILLPAYAAGRVARRKGRPFAVWLVGGLLLGPFVLIAALLLPPRSRC